MSKETQALRDDIGTLAQNARAIMTDTANLTGEIIGDTRQRAATALQIGKDMYGRVHDKAVDNFSSADKLVHQNPYQSLGIALGVGALVGYLIVRYCAGNGNSSPLNRK